MKLIGRSRGRQIGGSGKADICKRWKSYAEGSKIDFASGLDYAFAFRWNFMAILGVGIDIVDVNRIRKMAEEHGERFLKRVFSDEELAYCFRFSDPFPHLAARWAAKEAVSKALGTGFTRGVTWKSICIVNAPNGEPLVVLKDGAQRFAANLGVRKIWVSISHTRDYAVSVAVMEA
jgi:holo-[acyl-carrier protein] synthase